MGGYEDEDIIDIGQRNGNPGAYLKKRMLYVLAEEIGHDYEALLAGAIGNGEGNDRRVPGDTSLPAARQQIQMPNGGRDEVSSVVKHSHKEENSETDEEDSSDNDWYARLIFLLSSFRIPIGGHHIITKKHHGDR